VAGIANYNSTWVNYYPPFVRHYGDPVLGEWPAAAVVVAAWVGSMGNVDMGVPSALYNLQWLACKVDADIEI
jgi:hypothetical protein